VSNGWGSVEGSIDNAASQAFVIGVKNHCLAGSDCPLGFMKKDLAQVFVQAFNDTSLLSLPVAGFSATW
jgi:hypothetical protein